MSRRTLKLIMATSMVIFNLLTVFAGTWAWFVNMRKLSGDEMAIRIEAHELHLDYNIYKFDQELKEIVEVDHLNLNPYDTIIAERNSQNAIIIKAVLQSNLFVNNSSYNINIKAHCTNISPINTDCLSDIVYFKFAPLAISATTAEAIYNQALVGLEAAQSKTFYINSQKADIELDLVAPIVDNTITIYSIFNYEDTLIANKNYDFQNPPVIVNDIEYIRYEIHE